MKPHTSRTRDSRSSDENEVCSLYQEMLGCWNKRNAGDLAALFAKDGTAAVLRAVAGMVPPGQSDLNPTVNTVQTLVATKHHGQWRIVVFQNTPAAFHGRPDLSEKLTEELRQVLRAPSPDTMARQAQR